MYHPFCRKQTIWNKCCSLSDFRRRLLGQFGIRPNPFGLELQSFTSTIMPNSADQITWHIGGLGFDMVLLGRVPQTIAKGLPSRLDSILAGQRPENIEHWAIHPGGRTILDAVQGSIGLPDNRLRQSRDILRRFGNMSSATVMFVLKEMMQSGTAAGRGCAMAFGPGLTAESMLFSNGREQRMISHEIHSRRRRYSCHRFAHVDRFFRAMRLGMFMSILDIQIVASSLPDIQTALYIPQDRLSWIQTAYLIAEIIAIPLTGWLTRLVVSAWPVYGRCIRFYACQPWLRAQ